MYVFDTDTLTLAFSGHRLMGERRRAVPAAAIAVSVITQIEMLRGRFDFLLKAANGEQLLRAQTLLEQTQRGLAEFATILSIDALAAAEFDRLRDNKKLKKVGRADLLIAAIALARRATVVTRNTRHFRDVPGLRVENWAD